MNNIVEIWGYSFNILRIKLIFWLIVVPLASMWEMDVDDLVKSTLG